MRTLLGFWIAPLTVGIITGGARRAATSVGIPRIRCGMAA
jgi:hypothetical protein